MCTLVVSSHEHCTPEQHTYITNRHSDRQTNWMSERYSNKRTTSELNELFCLLRLGRKQCKPSLLQKRIYSAWFSFGSQCWPYYELRTPWTHFITDASNAISVRKTHRATWDNWSVFWLAIVIWPGTWQSSIARSHSLVTTAQTVQLGLTCLTANSWISRTASCRGAYFDETLRYDGWSYYSWLVQPTRGFLTTVVVFFSVRICFIVLLSFYSLHKFASFGLLVAKWLILCVDPRLCNIFSCLTKEEEITALNFFDHRFPAGVLYSFGLFFILWLFCNWWFMIGQYPLVCDSDYTSLVNTYDGIQKCGHLST
jgi:hypothetical protein